MNRSDITELFVTISSEIENKYKNKIIRVHRRVVRFESVEIIPNPYTRIITIDFIGTPNNISWQYSEDFIKQMVNRKKELLGIILSNIKEATESELLEENL